MCDPVLNSNCVSVRHQIRKLCHVNLITILHTLPFNYSVISFVSRIGDKKKTKQTLPNPFILAFMSFFFQFPSWLNTTITFIGSFTYFQKK